MIRILHRAWRRYRYTAYLRSPQWQRVRQKALKRAGYRCERCRETQGLQAASPHLRTLWTRA